MKQCAMVVIVFTILFSAFAGGEAEMDMDMDMDATYEIIWYHFGGQPNADEYDQFFGELNEYLTEKINVTLRFQALDSYSERMNLIANSGERWDLAFTAGWAFNYRENALKGVFHPLNDLLEEHGQDILNILSPAFFDGNRIDGEVYAVPTNKEIGNWPVNVMSKKIIDQYGIVPEEMTSVTYDTFLPYIEQFKRDYPNDYPMWPEPIDGAIRDRENITWLNLSLPFVFYVDQRDLKIRNQFEVPEQISVYRKFKQLIDAGYIHPDLPTLTSVIGAVTNELSKGNFLVKHDLAFPGAGPALETRYRIPIYFTATADPVAENSSVSGSMLAISANSQRPDKVMQFLNLLNSDEYVRNALNWGIEGVHYEQTGANRIVRSTDANWPIPQFTLQNFFILWLTEGQPDDLWVEFAKFNNSAAASPALGFTPDYTTIRGEIDAITNTMEEFKNFLFDGDSVDASLAEINTRLDRDGIDKVMAELQRQFDAWYAAQ